MMDLIERLEAAEKGSRELDEYIAEAVFPTIKRQHASWYIDDIRVRIEPYTTSMDAALTLVPEGEKGWPFWEIKSPNPNSPYLKGYHGGSKAQIWLDGTTVFFGHARTPALALSAAGLRAFEAMKEKADG